ncbi:hypothetical protein CYLTODRAFT_226538 [Cylindrobasidium torrendii FP15055 ss-10]|uniref:Uncharacterized protein n=1 Tax=Cylindrobasidium torrendii FP15055 ss-10 TaxID=1314674 RepID=A0A0D7BIJ4_9AGAR|nr:hypothetical protein CYLTODRAFT_226538 [Cylindrobasidium torrendii FP15055 ss-10]
MHSPPSGTKAICPMHFKWHVPGLDAPGGHRQLKRVSNVWTKLASHRLCILYLGCAVDLAADVTI